MALTQIQKLKLNQQVDMILQSPANQVRDGKLEMTFVYDLWAFFDKFPLNATAVAAWIGINPSLMRQYLSGARKPSKARMQQIEDGVRRMARQMAAAPLMT